jgi:signal transduction histidine kinase
MAKSLRLLIIEDEEDHALLLVRELQKGGFDPAFERVEAPEELESALDAGPWDAVISDYNMPGFNGLDALRLLQAKGLDLPFILVSGVIGEEQAVEALKTGAHDFILKGNLARLVPALQRELREAAVRHERRQTAEELSRHREHLEELVQQRTEELTAANEELQAQSEELISSMDELQRFEQELRKKGAELEASNLELEAFNYSVAHDLRQPLNVISGFCQVIKELCGDQLNEECMGYLQETSNGVFRMNRLIEALLNFSRLGHVEPRREAVDLSAMAQVVAAGLKLAEPGRRVTFLIADGVGADGDAALLRVVMDNLLGNAWKYNGTRDEGFIEFGTTEIDGKPAYFVRDNGTGFDMTNAAKLFIPFQRLPGAEEFKGFGIGLATVERIIRRHGGKIWAEGGPDKGATFWFTLSGDGR